DSIIVGELQPGQHLVEQAWAARLGIGQPTIRDLLRELEYQGFVEKIPRRGTYVTQLKEGDYRRILEVRIPLESLAIGRAAIRMTHETEQQLTSLVVRMGSAAEAGDLKGFHENDVMFHRAIWDLADNAYLKSMLEGVAFRLFVFSVVGPRPNKRNANLASVQQHVGILAGLTTRDAGQARRAFVSQTLKYWNEHYSLDLTVDEFQSVAVMRP